MYITTHALVLREVTYKESDKILTVLSRDMGKMTVSARGCRKKNSPIGAGCQLFVWSQFVLYEFKGRWTAKEVMVDHSFSTIPQDFMRFSLACYFAEVCEALSIEDLPQDDLLNLLLNCLYALDKETKLSVAMIKSVFELRAICQSGYEPMVDYCSICHTLSPKSPQLSLTDGTIHCLSCGGRAFPLSDASLETMRYIIRVHPKQIFHFTLSDFTLLSRVTEAYLLTQLDRPFKTLEFFKKYQQD